MKPNYDPQISQITQIWIGRIIAETRVGGARFRLRQPVRDGLTLRRRFRRTRATPGKRTLGIRAHVQLIKSA